MGLADSAPCHRSIISIALVSTGPPAASAAWTYRRVPRQRGPVGGTPGAGSRVGRGPAVHRAGFCV